MPTTYAAAVSLAESMYITPGNPHGWVPGFDKEPAKFLQENAAPPPTRSRRQHPRMLTVASNQPVDAGREGRGELSLPRRARQGPAFPATGDRRGEIQGEHHEA